MGLLIKNGYVVTMNASRDVCEGGFVAIADGRIVDVGPSVHCPAGDDVFDATGMIVLPGLINAWQHHWHHLLVGGHPAGGDLASLLARCEAAIESEDLRAAGWLAAIDMISTGTTCVLNHGVRNAGEDDVAASIEPMAAIGLRQTFALDVAVASAGPNDRSLDETIGFLDASAMRWHRADNDLIRIGAAIDSSAASVAFGRTMEDLIQRAHAAARDRGLRLIHRNSSPASESGSSEIDALRLTGRSEIMHLMELGVLDANGIIGPGSTLDSTDFLLMGEARCHAVYTPVSDALWGYHAKPWASLARAGVNGALGSGGPARQCSNDMVEQIKACLLIQNTSNLDPLAMSVETALEMATINAARALGLDREIGSLEPGKQADIAVFDLSAPQVQVVHKPISNFVCCAHGSDARLVMVRGRVVARDGELLHAPDVRDVVAEARVRRRDLFRRARLSI